MTCGLCFVSAGHKLNFESQFITKNLKLMFQISFLLFIGATVEFAVVVLSPKTPLLRCNKSLLRSAIIAPQKDEIQMRPETRW